MYALSTSQDQQAGLDSNGLMSFNADYATPGNTGADTSIPPSFQFAAGESLADRARHAIRTVKKTHPQGKTFVLAGGVAANQYLRGRLESVISDAGMELVAPPVALCTDNAAMIAWAGVERFRLGMIDGLDFEPRARWPLA